MKNVVNQQGEVFKQAIKWGGSKESTEPKDSHLE
jgi:hypothetical protein